PCEVRKGNDTTSRACSLHVRRAGCWSLPPQSPALTALLPPPALRERGHGGLARRARSLGARVCGLCACKRGKIRHRRGVSSLARHARDPVPNLSVKNVRVRCFGPTTRQPPRRRLRRRGLPLGAFRPHRLGGIGDRWFLWRKQNCLPLQFARCILRLWVPLAWLLPRFLPWDPRRRFWQLVGSHAASARELLGLDPSQEGFF